MRRRADATTMVGRHMPDRKIRRLIFPRRQIPPGSPIVYDRAGAAMAQLFAFLKCSHMDRADSP